MSAEKSHGPSALPKSIPSLEAASHVRDVRTDAVMTTDEWIQERMEAEGRSREECLEELVNAIARGDLVEVDEPR